MTSRHDGSPRMILAAALVALFPLASALAATTTGLDVEEPTSKEESGSRISQVADKRCVYFGNMIVAKFRSCFRGPACHVDNVLDSYWNTR